MALDLGKSVNLQSRRTVNPLEWLLEIELVVTVGEQTRTTTRGRERRVGLSSLAYIYSRFS